MLLPYSASDSELVNQSSTGLAKHFHYINDEIDTGYNYNPPMDFVFYSDKEVSGVSLVVRLSADMDLTLTPDIYYVSINGRQIMFEQFEIKPYFARKHDFVLSTTETIREGHNIIQIVVRQNSLGWHGMSLAPGFAHVRLENFQGAELLWRPHTYNLRSVFTWVNRWVETPPEQLGTNLWNS